MIVFCTFLYAFETAYKNILNINLFGAATLIKREKIKTKTKTNTLYIHIYIYIYIYIYITYENKNNVSYKQG